MFAANSKLLTFKVKRGILAVRGEKKIKNNKRDVWITSAFRRASFLSTY